MKIAFIGTGLMGYPMASNLLKKKLNLKVFSRTLDKAKPLEKLGAHISSSLGEAVKDTNIIITRKKASTQLELLCLRCPVATKRCITRKCFFQIIMVNTVIESMGTI